LAGQEKSVVGGVKMSKITTERKPGWETRDLTALFSYETMTDFHPAIKKVLARLRAADELANTVEAYMDSAMLAIDDRAMAT
jgi:hypothetical protein